MFARLHHRVSLCNPEVNSCRIDSLLTLRRGLVLPGQFEVLLEVADTLLYELLLIVEQTQLEGGICLRLCLILGLCDIH
jgi:hypothetical protein